MSQTETYGIRHSVVRERGVRHKRIRQTDVRQRAQDIGESGGGASDTVWSGRAVLDTGCERVRHNGVRESGVRHSARDTADRRKTQRSQGEWC